MNLEVKIEPTATGFSAYVEDLPGCVAAAETRDEVERLIREAIEFHLEGLVLSKAPVTYSEVSVKSTFDGLFRTDNTPFLFVEIVVPLTSSGMVLQPKVEPGEAGAAA